MSTRDRWILFGGLAAIAIYVFALVVLPNTRIYRAYDGPPMESSSVPTIEIIDDWSSAGGPRRTTGNEETYSGSWTNLSDRPQRERIIQEYFDYRGNLIRRHVIASVEVPPHSRVSVTADIPLSPRERRYVVRVQSRHEPQEP